MTIEHVCFPSARRKACWIKNRSGLVLIDCAGDISVSVEKFTLNWFNLKKFIGKKNGGSDNTELLKTGDGLCKAVNSAKS